MKPSLILHNILGIEIRDYEKKFLMNLFGEVTMQKRMRILHDALFEFAVEQLNSHGEFSPFGGSINTNGEIKWAIAGPEIKDDTQRLNVVFEGLCFEADSGRILAAGYCADMDFELMEYPDGIRSVYIVLEDGTGRSLKFVHPYEKQRDGDWHFHEALTDAGEPQIFGSTL